MKLLGITFIVALVAFSSMLYAQTAQYHVIVGTYTDKGSKGIYVYSYDSQTGKMALKSSIASSNPSFLTVSPDRKFVYAVNEDHQGGVSAFRYNSTSGQLTFLNKKSSGGDEPCYISIDASGKFVFAANYTSGAISAIPLHADGSLGSAIQTIKHTGPLGTDKARQEAPHAHCIVLSPDNKYVLSANLGTDKINIYNFNPAKPNMPLTPAAQSFVSIKAGSGPRHILFHQNKKFAYLVSELSSTVTVFTYNAGHLTTTQTITMLANGYKGEVSAADVHISPDGKFLYASNRENLQEIVIYSIDQASGKLTFVGRSSSMGKHPRNFAIDPSGNFLLVANRDTDDIVIFKRDQKTGLIKPTGEKVKISHPVCIQFVKN